MKVKLLDLQVSDFELQLSCIDHFRSNTHGKV